jgi:hypothetical protein
MIPLVNQKEQNEYIGMFCNIEAQEIYFILIIWSYHK